MINIYTNIKEAEQDKRQTVRDNDAEFISRISPFELDNTDRYFIKVIDRAEVVLDRAIKTPFGGTDIKNLSTGCKTLININHILKTPEEAKNTVVRVTGCGPNALAEAFKLVDDKDIWILLEHIDIADFYRANYKYNVRGHGVVNFSELIYFISK